MDKNVLKIHGKPLNTTAGDKFITKKLPKTLLSLGLRGTKGQENGTKNLKLAQNILTNRPIPEVAKPSPATVKLEKPVAKRVNNRKAKLLKKCLEIIENFMHFIHQIISIISTILLICLVPFAIFFCFLDKMRLKLSKITHKDPYSRENRNTYYNHLQNMEKGGGHKKPTLVLDLDQTLIYCSEERFNNHEEQLPVSNALGKDKVYFLSKRPYLDSFLEYAAKYYNIIVYTASQKEYADAIIDHIDTKGVIFKRLYRDSCKRDHEGQYVKDLRIINEDLAFTVMIDDSEKSIKKN